MKTERCRSRFSLSGAVLGLAVAVGASGCKSSETAHTPAPIVDANGGPDPAAVNTAPLALAAAGSPVSTAANARQPARVLGQEAYGPPPTASGEQYPEQAGAVYPAQGQAYPPAGDDGSTGYDAAYEQQVDAGQDALYASQPPPPLPVYAQPELTDPNDQWTPGYWSYAPQGYYWVPGAWVAPPFVGALWTPGYWGFYGGRYRFHHGFWGRHFGFYGGVPYGFGYTGQGYEGGYWNGNRFFYNNAVNRVNGNVVHNVYARNVRQVQNSRVSFNGPGGWNTRPTASDVAVLHEQRLPAMSVQRQRVQEAAGNRQQFAGENHGRPAMTVLAERQPADRVTAAALPAGVRPETAGGAGQGSAPRPEVPGQLRPGNQVQTERREAETQPRSVPEQQQRVQNQQRQAAEGQQRQVADQQQRRTADQQQRQVQEQQRQVPQQDQQRGGQPQFAMPAQQRQPEQQMRTVPDAAREQPRPEPEVRFQPHSQTQFRPQSQPEARPQMQVRPELQNRPQQQAAPAGRTAEPRPAEAPHPQGSHPHL